MIRCSWSVQLSDGRALELLAYNIHRETRMGGELKREVAEAAANRGVEEGVTPGMGRGKWVDRVGEFYELGVTDQSAPISGYAVIQD